MINLNEMFSETELVDTQLFDGFPVIQLRIKEGLFEGPLDQLAGFVADNVEVRDFEHDGKVQKGYAWQSLLVTVVVCQSSYVTKYQTDPKNPKSEVAQVVTPNYVAGSRSRIRALCLSPEIGTTDENGAFTPKPFILTVGGLQTKAFNQVFGYRPQSGEFFTAIARPLAMLIAPTGNKSFPELALATPVSFGAKDSFNLPDGSKLYYYPLAGGWTKDDLEVIKQLESMRPKTPTIGKSMPDEVKAAKLKRYREEMTEFKAQAIAMIEKSPLSRLFVGYHKAIDLIADDVAKYHQNCLEFEATQRENEYYDYLAHCSQYRFPKGSLAPMDVLQNQCGGNVAEAISAIDASMAMSSSLKSLPLAIDAPLSEVALRHLELA